MEWEPSADAPVRPGRARWILAGLVTAAGAAMFVWTVRSGRADSALLFVGLPVVLALALVLIPGRTTHGRVFQITTALLLVTAVALHEGAICVILAAPLVYGAAHGTAALVRLGRNPYALVPIPLLLLSAVEGVRPDLRWHPEQTATAARVVALTPDEVWQRLARGPAPTAVRSLPLRLLGMPTPHHVTGTGLRPGDRWVFHYPHSSHGSGGQTVTEVTAARAGRVNFIVVEDSAITSRWLVWRHATVSWRPVGDHRIEVTVSLSYLRRLDPSWYFGPLQQVLMADGAGYLLDALALT